MAIARSTPNTLYAVTATGVYKTVDGGDIWSRVLAGYARAVAVDSENEEIVYAGLDAYPATGLLRSQDGGATWASPGGSAGIYVVNDIMTRASAPETVFVAFGIGILRSVDRGLSFSRADSGLTGPGLSPLRLAADPSSPQALYVLTDFSRVFRTGNAGASWTPVPLVPSLVSLDLSVSATGRIFYASTTDGVLQFERSFLDLPDTHALWSSVDVLALNGVTAGCGDGNFCPASPTSRAQAAPLLLKAKLGAGFTPPPASGALFGDVSASSFAAAWIEELSRQGLTSGCGGGNYCPNAPLSRAEVAVLLLKAKHGPTYSPPPAAGGVFADVPPGSFAAAWIEALFAEGITAGCGGGMFCPNAPATRAQMATFLVRAFELE